ncbi:restriction endonuclease subunit S [Prevotella copri]|uniref:restriction endonuclease subunit S n=1 Tax=Segatella copri TaxID=165179 RepID=UPI001C4669AF|nr:restriction endonuclease subunit S [Segatella copri]MBW0033796.1 restriction endonuclease subunit S [Segatella copri]
MGGVSMEFTTYTLGEVCSRLSSGKSIKAAEIFPAGKYPVYGGNGLRGYADRSNFEGECAIIGRQGAYCGNVRYFKGEAYMTEHAVVCQANEKANTYYLSALLSTMHLERLSGQSAQPGLAVGTLSVQEINLPSLEAQRSIASILSSLDRKIELNNKINADLEEMAQSIFKNWFVDFEPFKDGKFVDSELGMIPEGWKVGTLGEFCKCLLGGTPSRSKEEYWNGEVNWINSGEINKFRILEASEKITELGLAKSATKLLPKKTTVLAITGATLGQVSLLEIDTCANQSVIGVLENTEVPYEYIYPFIKDRIEMLIQHQTGGAQQHINKDNVESLIFLLPAINVLEDYISLVSPMYKRIESQCFENLYLSTLRDTLLPRLMSGELEVPE